MKRSEVFAQHAQRVVRGIVPLRKQRDACFSRQICAPHFNVQRGAVRLQRPEHHLIHHPRRRIRNSLTLRCVVLRVVPLLDLLKARRLLPRIRELLLLHHLQLPI